jgi:hypothetical protein
MAASTAACLAIGRNLSVRATSLRLGNNARNQPNLPTRRSLQENSPMAEDQPVATLSRFIDRVSSIRKTWQIEEHKELWFRGEGEEHTRSILRPALYRPQRGTGAMKDIRALLDIESELYEEFRRCGAQLISDKIEEEYREWDWYFLMRHHDAPTRLLDWSDGALIALHFALHTKTTDALRDEETKKRCKPRVYVLGPDRLKKCLDRLFEENRQAKENWKKFVEKHPSFRYGEDREEEWEFAYVPADKEEREELPIPKSPLVLDFPHITRRVAAQRSRFVVFGEDPFWLEKQYEEHDFIRVIEIDPDPENISKMRIELRQCGVTESVIFPDLDGLGREIKQVWEDRK